MATVNPQDSELLEVEEAELLPDDDAEPVPLEEHEAPKSRVLWMQEVPAWMISTLFHVLVMVGLGLVTFADPVRIVNVLSATASTEDGPEIEEFTIEEIDPGDVEEMEETTEQVDVVEPTEVTPVEMPMDVAVVAIDTAQLATEIAPTEVSLQSLQSMPSRPMGSRSTDMKEKMLRKYGGNASSEAAVTEALKWFSRHQLPNGAWTFQHNLVCRNTCGDACKDPAYRESFNAATALALLPFLGAGQTHVDGDFKNVVRRGLYFLVNNGKFGNQGGLPVMDFRDRKGNMYSHGLAAIALCEAYAMTNDSTIAPTAQAALNFIIYAQGRDGGWRYRPRQNDGGDTSVVGWQVMALKSGHMGHLMVPPQVIQGSIRFLDRVQSDYGSVYGYTGPVDKFRPATSSVGLLCRMYTGWEKTHVGITKGVQHISDHGMSETDLYYDYYAAQVLRHHGGPEWEKFNVQLRDHLVDTQDQRPGYKGSWYFDAGKHTAKAGRLCATSFATMILEIYYRHMPLYAEKVVEEDFPL